MRREVLKTRSFQSCVRRIYYLLVNIIAMNLCHYGSVFHTYFNICNLFKCFCASCNPQWNPFQSSVSCFFVKVWNSKKVMKVEVWAKEGNIEEYPVAFASRKLLPNPGKTIIQLLRSILPLSGCFRYSICICLARDSPLRHNVLSGGH